jgi:hypothetical protein
MRDEAEAAAYERGRLAGIEEGRAAERARAEQLALVLRDTINRLATLNIDVFRGRDFTDRYEDGDANDVVIRLGRAALTQWKAAHVGAAGKVKP